MKLTRRQRDMGYALLMVVAIVFAFTLPQPLKSIQMFACSVVLGWKVSSLLND